MNNKIYKYDNLGEFLKVSKDNADSAESSHREYDEDFHLLDSYEEAVDLIYKGVPEAQRVFNLMKKFEQSNSLPIKIPEIVYDVSGNDVDIGLFLEEDPECMYSYMPESERPVLSIFYSISENCNITAEQMANRAAAILLFITSVERMGTAVELYAFSAGTGLYGREPSDTSYYDIIKIKSFSDYVSAGQIAFSGYPDFFRRLMFGVFENKKGCRGHNYEIGWGYGTSITSRKKIEKTLEEHFPTPGDRFLISTIGDGKHSFTSEESIEKAVIDWLTRLKNNETGWGIFERAC